MEQSIMYIFTIVIVFFIGFSLIINVKNKLIGWIPLSFLVGTGILVLTSFWISYLSKEGIKPLAKIVLYFFCISGILSIIKNRERVYLYIKAITLKDILLLALCVLGGVLPMLIRIIYGAEFPYCDGYTYICNADYFMVNGYRIIPNPEDMINHPWLSQTYLYQEANLRIGAQMLLAFLSSIFNLKYSIEMFSPITGFSVFLCSLAIWFFVETNFKVNHFVKTATIVFVLFNVPIIQGNAMYGFLPQTLGNAFFIVCIAIVMKLNGEMKYGKWNLLFGGLFISVFALTYNEMLPFLVLLGIIILINKIIKEKNNTKGYILNLIKLGIISILPICVYVPGMIIATISQMGAIVGFNQEKDLFTYLGYLFSLVPAEYSFRLNIFEDSMYLMQIAIVIVFGCFIAGFIKGKKDIKFIFVLLSIPYAILFIFFIFKENPFVGGTIQTWSIYKLVQYYFVTIASFLGFFIFEYLYDKMKRGAWLVLIVFIVWNTQTSLEYSKNLAIGMKEYTGTYEEPIETYYKIEEKYADYEGVIELVNVPDKHRQMITYFLKDVKLVSNWETDVYFNTIPIINALSNSEPDIKFCYNQINNFIVEENSISIGKLYELNNYLEIVSGKANLETDGIESWHWCGKEVEVDVNIQSDEQFSLEFQVWPIATNDKAYLKVYEQDKEIYSFQLSDSEFTNIEISLSKLDSEIRLFFEGDSSLLIDDGNQLVFKTTEWKLIQ